MYHKETRLAVEPTNFTIEPLLFQNRFLEGAHSFLDLKP